MITKFEIIFETKDMNKVYSEASEDGEDMTKEFEKILHERFITILKEISNKEEWFDCQMMDDDEINVEGYETLDDYGNVQIKIKELK